jgi:hypothetical protein
VHVERRHQREAGGADDHPQRSERARPVAVGPDPGKRRGDEHAERERRELDPGGDRVVALRALVVEDEDEHQREARQAVDERGAGRGGEHAVAEDVEVEHRCPRARLDEHEGGQQDDAHDEAADDERVAPADQPAARDAEDEAGEAEHEHDRAGQVESAHLVGPGELAQDQRAPRRPGEAERHVEPEDPGPRDRDEPAAEHGPEHEADRGDHRVRPHRDAELLARERIGDERRGVREQERPADPLHDAPEDELCRVAREPGAERREREDDEAAEVGALAPEEVRQPPRREHEHGRGDHVREDHPDELQHARVQAAAEIRQGDDERARVDRREQHPEARARQRPPLVVRVLGVDAGTARARGRRGARGLGGDVVLNPHLT